MTCGNCGCQFQDGMTACPNCGTKVVDNGQSSENYNQGSFGQPNYGSQVNYGQTNEYNPQRGHNQQNGYNNQGGYNPQGGYNQPTGYNNYGAPIIRNAPEFVMFLVFGLVYLLCCCNLIVGVVGLIFTILMNQSYRQGDAISYTKYKNIAKWAYIVGIAFTVVNIIIAFASGLVSAITSIFN